MRIEVAKMGVSKSNHLEAPSMRSIKRTLQKLLGLVGVSILDLKEVVGLGVVICVKPTGKPKCPECGAICGGYDERDPRRWRHVDLWGRRCYLEARVRRVECPEHGVRSEAVSWATPGSMFTAAFENWVTWFTQRCDRTMVAALSAIAWRTVGTIVERVMDRTRPSIDWKSVTAIGVDELSYRKHHRYVTIVTDLGTGRVLWSTEGKDAAALAEFLKTLPRSVRRGIQYVTMDMSGAYAKAVREHLPHAKIVYDRFHVEKLANEALDETRREQRRLSRQDGGSDTTKYARWPLLKAPWNLTPKQSGVLSTIQQTNARLYRAYLLKESLAGIFRSLTEPEIARTELAQWRAWACRSQLPAFVRLAKTIGDHLEGVLAYFETGYSNGRVEGINNKIRLGTRQAYGLHRAESASAMIELRCTGITLPTPCGQ